MWINDVGRPHISEDELEMEGGEDWDCNRGRLLEFVREMGEGWPDGAIVRMLLRESMIYHRACPWCRHLMRRMWVCCGRRARLWRRWGRR